MNCSEIMVWPMTDLEAMVWIVALLIAVVGVYYVIHTSDGAP